ncbi:MAG: hypothetical protein IT379_41855 [Deltaproteobacteria bacterium]|nr:hypothetical protein [Deltaproteobacteria bacterium]
MLRRLTTAPRQLLSFAAIAVGVGVACTSPLEDRVIACTSGVQSTCPDGWRCRRDATSGRSRCFRSGTADPAPDGGPPDARATDAAVDRDATTLRDASLADVPDTAWAPPVPGVSSRDAEPPDGFTRSDCRPEWERLLRGAASADDYLGAWCERPRNLEDEGITFCGYRTELECECNWEGRLRESHRCVQRPAELHCMWSRRCGSPHDDPTQWVLGCFEELDQCQYAARPWRSCDHVALTRDEDLCGAPDEVPVPTSGEPVVPPASCCRD